MLFGTSFQNFMFEAICIPQAWKFFYVGLNRSSFFLLKFLKEYTNFIESFLPPWGFDPRSLDAVVKLVTNNSTGPRCPTQAWKVSGSNVGSHITHPSLYVMLDREECTESTDIYSSKDLWQK